MSFLFPQKKPKTLGEVVYALNEWIIRASDAQPPHKPLAGPPPTAANKHGGPGLFAGRIEQEIQTEHQKQASEEAGRLLAQVRQSTWARSGESGSQPAEPDQLAALAKEVYATDVLVPLLQNLRVLDFDARRDVASFFAFILKRQPTVDYLLNKVPEVFTILMTGAGNVEVHRTICQILRECARHEALVSYMMTLQNFWWFFQYVDHQEFEVATDNFTTFQDFLRNFPDLTTSFLLRNMDYFTQCINGLISSKNYVARRQSLRLLFQLMKQPRNHQYLLTYCSSVESLKLVMQMLKDKSKNIHYEAFQIFKCFVVNPNKPRAIVDILVRNKAKLIGMLEKPHTLADRREDQAYQNEREYVKEKIIALPTKGPAPQAQGQHKGHEKAQYNQPSKPGQYMHYQAQPAYQQHPNAPQLHPLAQQSFAQKQSAPLAALPMYSQTAPESPSPHPNNQGPSSPSRAQVPPALMNARPASPVLSHPQSFPEK